MVTTYDLESFALIEPRDCPAPTTARLGDRAVELRLVRVDETARHQAKTVEDYAGVIGMQALACLAE